jgi:hypothetical protein
MPLNDQHVRALLVACRETHADEIDCEEFLTHMAQYAEARASGQSIAEELAKVAAHERLCANCAEECHALVDFVRTEPRAAN